MNVNEIRRIIFETVGFEYDKDIVVYEADSLIVKYDGETASIGYDSKTSLARGYFLFAMHSDDGMININQKKSFDMCGCMIDVSRNGVITVESAKKYINYMAALGLNMLMLYTEDTYEIKEYPYFGYMRGRYSVEELKEIDSYAEQLGIEVIPCIQTLAHLRQFLKYPNDLSDTPDILLAWDEKTYEFIEAQIKTMRSAFGTGRIHIGMDEAENIGRGKFLDKHGYVDPYVILTKHLNRVAEICRKYNFRPMMWNDMFFNVSNENHFYYTKEDLSFEDEMLKNIPDVDMVYWDYYNEDKELYRAMLKNSAKLSHRTVFAGGIDIWYGMLPDGMKTVNTTKCALETCLEEGTKEVFATMWGDDGTETNVFFSVHYLPLFSEYCYRGINCRDEDIRAVSEYLTKISSDSIGAINNFHYKDENCQYNGKKLFYADIMYDCGFSAEQCEILKEIYTNSAKTINQYKTANMMMPTVHEYAELVFEICAIKADLGANLRKSYKEKNKNYFKMLASEILPLLREKYALLKEIHKKQWNSTYKPFGFEVISFRYGGIMSRIDDCIEKFTEYGSGGCRQISELEEEILCCDFRQARRNITPSEIF